MPSFNIIKESSFESSFRTESIKGQFNLQVESIKEQFQGSIDIENKNWNIGIIYGASGTGKSTIAKQLFPENYIHEKKYGNFPIVDEMPENKTTEEITKTFNSVGFSTVWSWLKPYSVLSTGEKMRVDLARCLLDDKELIVFDEYTSVINRDVAKIASFALQKTVRKLNKKFVAVACHYDIIDWLEPDWTFCTDIMSFQFGRCHRRPEINLEIYKVGREYWDIFKKYHYLNVELAHPAQCFCCFINDYPVAFNAVLHHPNKKIKNYKRSSRVVVLPDFQGIGIGNILVNEVAEFYKQQGFRFIAVNSNPIMAYARSNDKKWILKSKSRKETSYPKRHHVKFEARSRITYSFEYIGGEKS